MKINFLFVSRENFLYLYSTAFDLIFDNLFCNLGKMDIFSGHLAIPRMHNINKYKNSSDF